MAKERIIYVFLLVIAGVVLVNLLRNERDMMPFEEKRYWIVKTHSTKEFPVVFGGDSRVYRGISPDHFQAELPGMKGVNLGYSALGYHPEYLDFVDQRLDRSADRPVIVFGISARPFTPSGLKARKFFWEKYGRKKEEIIQYKYFYNAQRLFAPFNILRIFRGDKRKKRSEMNLQLTYHFNGWMESHEQEPDTTFYNERYRNVFINNKYDEVGAEVFLRRVKEWSEQGVTVVGFRTPVSHTIHQLEDSLSGFSTDRFRVQFEEAGGYWVDVDRSDYLTYDGNHLDNESAIRLSRDLAASIGKILDQQQ